MRARALQGGLVPCVLGHELVDLLLYDWAVAEMFVTITVIISIITIMFIIIIISSSSSQTITIIVKD